MTRHSIVEGEPGAFPPPIAKFYNWLGRKLSRHDRAPATGNDDAGPESKGGPTSTPSSTSRPDPAAPEPDPPSTPPAP